MTPTDRTSPPSTPKAVQDCRELLLWLIPQLDKLPRNRRYTLGARLEERILAILESLVAAAYSRDKHALLLQANRDLEVGRHLWRLCFDLQGIPLKGYEHGSRLMLELGRQIGGWTKASQ